MGFSKQLERLLDDVISLQQQDLFHQAMDLLQNAPEALKTHWEYLFALGQIHIQLENYLEATRVFERCNRLKPKKPEIHFSLGNLYADQGLFALALHELRQCLKVNLDDLLEEEIQELISNLLYFISLAAKRHDCPVSRFEKACLKSDQGQRFIQDDHFKQAVDVCRQAVRLAPNWTIPRNNLSLSLFFTGQVEQAIAEAEVVLKEIDPENTHAAANLIRFHVCMGQREHAELYSPLLSKRDIQELGDLTKAIEGLAFLEDDQALWQIAHQVLEDDSRLIELEGGDAFYLLGAAAANTGHLKEARRLFQEAMDASPYPNRVERSLDVLDGTKRGRRRKTQKLHGPSLDGRFPYIHFSSLMSREAFDEYEQLLRQGNELPHQTFRQKIAEFANRYPQWIFTLSKSIWDEGMTETGLNMLDVVGTPRSYDEIRRFASSTAGTMEDRRFAWILLNNARQLTPGEALPLWDPDTNSWTQVSLFGWEMKPDEPVPNANIQALLDQAHDASREQDWEARESALFNAIALDPNCAEAARQLGILMISRDLDSDEGEHWLRRSIEMEPDFYLGMATLSSHLIHTKRPGEAIALLVRFKQAESLTFSTLSAYIAANTELAIFEGQFDNAERQLEHLEDILPNSPKVEFLKDLLEEARFYHRYWLENALRDHHRSRTKPIQPDDWLFQSLPRNTVERLKATARSWDCQTSGLKADLIKRLVKIMTSPEDLEWQVEQLSLLEQDALRTILELGGAIQWQRFVDQYGDDLEESPYWYYHEPTTVPGHLRMLGLLAVGTYEGEVMGVIPMELRQPLQQLLSRI